VKDDESGDDKGDEDEEDWLAQGWRIEKQKVYSMEMRWPISEWVICHFRRGAGWRTSN